MNNTKGIGMLGLLTVLLQVAFIVLKICNIIDGNGIIVFSPLIIYFGIGLAIIIVIGLVMAIYTIVEVIRDKLEEK